MVQLILYALAALGAVSAGGVVLVLLAGRDTEICVGSKAGVPIYAPRSRAVDRLLKSCR